MFQRSVSGQPLGRVVGEEALQQRQPRLRQQVGPDALAQAAGRVLRERHLLHRRQLAVARPYRVRRRAEILQANTLCCHYAQIFPCCVVYVT